MGFLSWLGGSNDHQLADSQYASRESASDRASRDRHKNHRRNIGKAAAQGEKWEQMDRARERRGRDRHTDWTR